MDPAQIKAVLTAIGISSGIIVVGLVVAGGFIVYKNYLEAEYLKLQIVQLKGELQNEKK